MRKRLHSLFLLTLLSFLCTLSVVAQVTTASMSGEVSSNNEPVIGATIVALHEPSGTLMVPLQTWMVVLTYKV